MAKKKHPRGLSHLSDAKTDKDVLAGAQAWAKAVSDGLYTFVVTEEHAIDRDTDLLVVVRRRVKK